MNKSTVNGAAPSERTATADDVLKGCDPADRAGNIRKLIDQGWDRKDAQREAIKYARGLPDIEPERFDFDAVQPEPEWVVHGLLERRTANVLSGDTGSAKSIHSDDLAVRAVKGEQWLNRDIAQGLRVLYLDEENSARIARGRLGALGMTNAVSERLRYYRRKGVRLSADVDDKWVKWLHAECEEFSPDLLIIDTAMAATSVEANDNREVVALYVNVLRAVAERHDLALLILHHERKPGAHEKRNAGFAMMGARQWAGQADVHMVLSSVSQYTETPRDDGRRDTRKEFRFSVEKARDGHSARPERTAVTSVKGEHFELESMQVEWLGRQESESAEDDTAERILRALAQESEPVSRETVATALGEKAPKEPSGTFRRAWGDLLDSGQTEKVGRRIRLTDAGREKASGLRLEL